jgi:hypothetical protein
MKKLLEILFLMSFHKILQSQNCEILKICSKILWTTNFFSNISEYEKTDFQKFTFSQWDKEIIFLLIDEEWREFHFGHKLNILEFRRNNPYFQVCLLNNMDWSYFVSFSALSDLLSIFEIVNKRLSLTCNAFLMKL